MTNIENRIEQALSGVFSELALRVIIAALSLALVSLLLGAPRAHAADLGGFPGQSGYRDAAPEVVPFNWTGLTVSVGFGADMTAQDGAVTVTSAGSVYHFPYAVNGDSGFGDLALGYNYQFPRSPLVIGVAADVSYAPAAHRVGYGVTGSMGVALGHARLYGELGTAWRTLDSTPTFIGVSIPEAKASGDQMGLVYGAGVEFALTNHWRVGVEAKRIDWASFSSDPANWAHVSVDAVEDRAQIMLIYAF